MSVSSLNDNAVNARLGGRKRPCALVVCSTFDHGVLVASKNGYAGAVCGSIVTKKGFHLNVLAPNCAIRAQPVPHRRTYREDQSENGGHNGRAKVSARIHESDSAVMRKRLKPGRRQRM